MFTVNFYLMTNTLEFHVRDNQLVNPVYKNKSLLFLHMHMSVGGFTKGITNLKWANQITWIFGNGKEENYYITLLSKLVKLKIMLTCICPGYSHVCHHFPFSIDEVESLHTAQLRVGIYTTNGVDSLVKEHRG